MPFAKDDDIVKLVRGNDGHAYLYADRKKKPCNVTVRQGGEVVDANGSASLPSVGGVQGCINSTDDLIQNGEALSFIWNSTR